MSTKADASPPQVDPAISLGFPFTTATSEKITSVNTRRLKVKDLREIGEQANGNEALLEILGVSRMCTMIPEDLDEMDAADYQKVKGRFLEYVGIGQKPAVSPALAGAVVPDAAK